MKSAKDVDGSFELAPDLVVCTSGKSKDVGVRVIHLSKNGRSCCYVQVGGERGAQKS